MALSSYDLILAALAGGKGQSYRWNKASITTAANTFWSLWTAAGQPGPGTFGGTALAARAVTKATTGALGFTNLTGPDLLHLSAMGALSSVAAGTVEAVDRVLDYSGISATGTGVQPADNTVTLPRYTDGAGVQMFAEVTTALGATPQTCTILYTNQAGTTGRSTSFAPTVSAVANRIPQTGYFIPLADGDTGVRKIESWQFGGSMGAGVLAFALVRPYDADVAIAVASMMVERNLVLHTPRLPQVVDNAAGSFLLAAATSSSGNISGRLNAIAG